MGAPAARAASATATRKGIDVRWNAPAAAPEQVPSPGARLLVRLERDRILHHGESEKAGSQELQAGVPQPMQQKLEAPEHAPAAGQPWLPGSTLDANAQLNRSYRYTVQLIEQATLDQHTLEIAGAPAQTPTLDARDLFPPAVPEDVTAVANAEGGTIDLSWSVSPDLDTAGYVIYRRTADTRAEPVRVSGDKPLPTAAWSDKGATKGVRYAYSVAAVDASGNVSARSAESIETLPQ